MRKSRMTRRHFLASGAAATLAMPHVRGAYAAGKLSVGFWDHWVPGANDVARKLVEPGKLRMALVPGPWNVFGWGSGTGSGGGA